MTSEVHLFLNNMLNTLHGLEPSFTAEKEKKIRAICEGTADADAPTPERILSRQEAAYLIHSSVDTVDLYCRKNWLKKIQPNKASRAIGISAKSVSDFTGISLKRLFDALDYYYRKDAA